MISIDLHCHGALGYAFDDADQDGIDVAIRYHLSQGADAVVMSLVSAPICALVARLNRLQEILPKISGALGVHLEGPFLSPERKGAHDPRALIAPTADAVGALLDAGAGIIRQVTLAPELPGALEATDEFVKAGVVVAIGHTAAPYDTAAQAFDRGAGLLTHTFNAMPGLGHRNPGPIGAALDRDHVVLEVIADGVHLHPSSVRTLFRAAPQRIALVTDAMPAAGLRDGMYDLGGLNVDVVKGRPVLEGTNTLAGSTLTLNAAMRNCIDYGISETDVAAAVSTTPGRLLFGAKPDDE